MYTVAYVERNTQCMSCERMSVDLFSATFRVITVFCASQRLPVRMTVVSETLLIGVKLT
jgi:hypothetical protein